MCSTGFMGEQAEREWMRGYQAARSLCLAKGVETARGQMASAPSLAFEAGFDWGLWDYEDANGLPHSRDRGA